MTDADSKCDPATPEGDEELSPTEGELKSNVLSLCTTEYNALRREIDWLVGNATQYQNFGIVATAAGVTALGVVSGQAPRATVAVFAVVPLLLWLFARLQLRAYEEIHVAAQYIAKCLAPRVRIETGIKQMWSWEEFKGAFNAETRRPAVERTTLLRRKLLFVLPASMFLGAGLTVLFVSTDLSPAKRWTALWWLALTAIGLGLTAMLDVLRYKPPYLDRPGPRDTVVERPK